MSQPRATILVVDDTPSNVDVMREVLSDTYELKLATSGEKALQLAFAKAPDLVLLDIMMPGLDGYEVCRRLKTDTRTRRVPVIFVTAMHEIEDEAQGFEVGCVDYIIKPVSPPLVRARVRTHLALYNQERHLSDLVAQRTSEVEATRLKVIQRLSRAADYRDDESGAHVLRLSQYVRALAVGAGLSADEATLLHAASAMHDVGKIGIPDAILQKPGPLTDAEWKVMHQHPLMGATIVGKHDDPLLETARIIALTHHERWDGGGYPRGLKGEDIPLAGRIVSICDTFDALISPRPYRAAWSVTEAVDYITEQSGRRFDPALVAKFRELQKEFAEINEMYMELVPRSAMAPG